MKQIAALSMVALPGEAVAPSERIGMGRLAIIGAFVIYLALLAAAWWGLLKLAPDQLTLTLAGRHLTLGNIHQKLIGNAALISVILPAAFWIECVVVGWRESSFRQLLFSPNASTKTDVAVFILGEAHVMSLLSKLMLLGASMISGLWIHDWLSKTTGLDIDPSGLPLTLQVVIYFYVYTFFDYWTHRVDHSRPFWPLHRYHHSAEEFCVVTSTRAHPAAFTAVFLISVPMAVLGASAEVMIYVNIATISLGFLIHSKIPSDFGWVGRWIIQSPVHHRLHHKLDMSYATGHFGMAPIWDHLFGTWSEKADPALAIGVSRTYRHGFWVAPDLLRDYWDFWRGFVVRNQEL